MQNSRTASISWNAQNMADFSKDSCNQRASFCRSPRVYTVQCAQYISIRFSLFLTLRHYTSSGGRGGEGRQSHIRDSWSIRSSRSSKSSRYTELMIELRMTRFKPASTAFSSQDRLHSSHLTWNSIVNAKRQPLAENKANAVPQTAIWGWLQKRVSLHKPPC